MAIGIVVFVAKPSPLRVENNERSEVVMMSLSARRFQSRCLVLRVLQNSLEYVSVVMTTRRADSA